VLSGHAVGKQVQTAAGIEAGIDLPARHERLQDQGLVPSGAKLLQLLGLQDYVVIGGIFVAPDDGLGRHSAMLGTVLLIADALAAVSMQEMEGGRRCAADRRVGLDRHGHQADA
jgi:hypothetical protein